jgi:hypothetical protein
METIVVKAKSKRLAEKVIKKLEKNSRPSNTDI